MLTPKLHLLCASCCERNERRETVEDMRHAQDDKEHSKGDRPLFRVWQHWTNEMNKNSQVQWTQMKCLDVTSVCYTDSHTQYEYRTHWALYNRVARYITSGWLRTLTGCQGEGWVGQVGNCHNSTTSECGNVVVDRRFGVNRVHFLMQQTRGLTTQRNSC